jgi:3-oxoacyl-[acyl-carrier protein] reductase
MDLQLEGKTALVTGASRGIGEGTAKVLAQDGVKCVIRARRIELLEQLADEIEQAGGVRPIPIAADLFEKNATRDLPAKAEEALGGIDILVNSAGRSKNPEAPKDLPFDYPSEYWDEEMYLNYGAIRELTFAVLPGMVKRKYGRIVNITGKAEPENIRTANPPKAAVHAWAKGLSRRVAKDGITVNCIPPGKIVSEQILRNYSKEEREAYEGYDITLGHFGDPADIGNLIAYLASPLGSHITGTVIPVDGGFRKHAF